MPQKNNTFKCPVLETLKHIINPKPIMNNLSMIFMLIKLKYIRLTQYL